MAPARFAVVDVGTNTILLLIAELKGGGGFEVLEDRAEITRLGAGVGHSRRIRPDALERSLKVLHRYLDRCRELSVHEIAVVGTSALRDALNAGDFQSRLKRELGLDLRVLSGGEEASYSYLAVQRGSGVREGEVLVVDVGGGSTEFIWGKDGRLHRSVSLDLGSVRLTERFLLSDPAREEECSRLTADIDEKLRSRLAAWSTERGFHKMVGIAGTFTTLAAVARGLTRYSHSDVHGSRLGRVEVQRQVRLFESKTVAERKAIPGLEPQRADVILAGALLIDRIMAFFRLDEVMVSDQGIRYGLLFERLESDRG